MTTDFHDHKEPEEDVGFELKAYSSPTLKKYGDLSEITETTIPFYEGADIYGLYAEATS
jgi:hypothetical protein